MVSTAETRSDRLLLEEDGRVQNILKQHLWNIQQSIGSTLFNQLHCFQPACKEHDGEESEILFNGRYACVNYVSQMLGLLEEDLLVRPAGTWIKYLSEDLKAAGWQQISEVDVEPGDIVIYDVFDGNEHTGFFIGNEMVVSTGREDTSDMEGSPRSPQPHHMFYQGRPDGPRTIQSYWTHPKFHQQY